MKKVIVIVGPTAVGKTSLSIQIAKKFHSEIISGDSIQVYQGFDIGSGKIKEEEKHGIQHHLIDILKPTQSYSVADFQQQARKIIDQANYLPIICGGTGLYIKACLYDYEFDEGNQEIDLDLLEKSNEELYEMIQAIDPKQLEKIHINNRQRLLRCLMIARNTGMSKTEIEEKQEHTLLYDAFIIGCTMERETLYQRINQRVAQMFIDGLEDEVKHLLKQGVTFEDAGMKGIGYREFEPYIKGECTIEEVERKIAQHARNYAKRQYTWFRNQMNVHWVDVSRGNDVEKLFMELEEWVKN